MLDYIINTLKGVFNNEGIRKESPKEEEKKPKGLNPKKKKKKSKKKET